MNEMLKRSSVVFALLIGGVLCVSFGPRASSQQALPPAVAAPPVAVPSEVGRYQLTRESVNSFYLLDTATGRIWYRYGTGAAQWEEQSPAFTKGK